MMDFEAWWLLAIPVLFAMGWVAARVDLRQTLSEQRNVPDAYFKGLNFLLNDQSDRAIDAFIEVAKVNPETVELHFALGSLFRRRGEIERAIRVHLSLLQRVDLPTKQKEQVMFELAQDYLKAGMLDRAESGFHELTCTRYKVDALRALVRIHEAERDWDKALEVVHDLQKNVDEPVPQMVHFYCEQALMELQAPIPDLVRVKQFLASAYDISIKLNQRFEQTDEPSLVHPRVLLLRSEMFLKAQCFNEVLDDYQTLCERYPDYAGMIALSYIQVACDHQNAAAAIKYLSMAYANSPSVDVFYALVKIKLEQTHTEDAWAFAEDALQKKPSLLGLSRFLRLQQEHPEVNSLVSNADFVLKQIQKHAQRVDRFACHACGFKAKRFYWQCPGCNAWETYTPKRLEEIDG